MTAIGKYFEDRSELIQDNSHVLHFTCFLMSSAFMCHFVFCVKIVCSALEIVHAKPLKPS